MKHRRRAVRSWALALIAGSAVALAPALGDPGATASAVVGSGGPASPLTAGEEADPAAAALARRFNPAMALPDGPGPWPVTVSYTWADGANLMSRTLASGGGGGVINESVARPSARLASEAWSDLPTRDRDGNAIQYWIDAPGDDGAVAGGGSGDDNGWRQRWRALAGAKPEQSRFPPTQYAHLFWLDRARGLLVIQYWFFFPFNEWINHHEGDWEHVNVILKGPSQLAAPDGDAERFSAVGHQFFFHGWRFEPEHPLRVPGADHDQAHGDHVVVFSGGRGQFLWWGGSQSGGSYPWAARFPGAGGGVGPFRVADDTRHPGRFLPPQAFQVVLLPEPDRLDARAHPELSWLALPFFAGQPHMRANPPLIDRFGAGRPPLQPGARRDWNSTTSHPRWTGTATQAESAAAVLPKEWHAAMR
jgi:hypothetical protein